MLECVGCARMGSIPRFEPGGLHAPDPASSECELVAFLASLATMLRSNLIVETGCHHGHATASLAIAAPWARVVSCDVSVVALERASATCRDLPKVELELCMGRDLKALKVADLAFIDSDYEFREEEIRATRPGAVVVVHDTERSYNSEIPPLREFVERLGGSCFSTPRGFGIIIR